MPTDIEQNERSRRVTDKDENLFDAAKNAVRLAELKGEHSLLAQRMSNGMENVTNILADLQASVRGLSSRMQEVVQLQHAHDTNRDSIAEVKTAISGIEKKLESWLDEVEKKNDQRWRDYEHNRDMWRQQHEASNASMKTTLETEIRSVRETLIRAVGWGGGAGVLVTVVVSGFLFWLNQKFEDTAVATERAYAVAVESTRRIDAQKDKSHEIELYLARGGVNPAQPYVPTQRKDKQ